MKIYKYNTRQIVVDKATFNILKKLKKQLELRSIAQVINYLLKKGGVSNGRKQN